MQGKEEDEGILSYVEDDDAAMCVSAHRTFAVIFLECYKLTCFGKAEGLKHPSDDNSIISGE